MTKPTQDHRTPGGLAAAMLIRPDGYVAWAASPNTPDNDGLRHALTTWFGTPAR